MAAQFVQRGKKIVAIGRNYVAHAKELNNAVPTEPIVFLKPTSSYTTASQIELPRGILVHHEVELGVVIGKGGREIKAADAMKHVAGYALAVDYTGRNLQNELSGKGLPWTKAKGFDDACPIGPFIPATEIKDPHALQLWFKINGELKQNDSTNLMIWRIPELIEHCSSLIKFEEGDLLLTGTPAGVGPVKEGDKISAGLEQDGEVISTIEHLVRTREGGYLFAPKN
ncbi:hypothetical protein BCR35DRAFT_319393 [Leucosporidium creatinivorum]|uniref:Fumarylacetoacetase-like C-terminal domain-containing protein n=1 Tax=Leucosporidium creatinivorum TaxID=106004 RepID=A0A1Y2DHD7_9BASI|nr:hypothetical protein BCR35DRAFT_319393 [Leucosporidium creatinivorum]